MSSEGFVDLHLHTNHSDGSDEPRRVVERGAALGFSAIAITDHDTLSGLEEGLAAAEALGLEFLTGTELSASYGKGEVHILGYGVDLSCPALNESLSRLREQREARTGKIVRRLKELGVDIDEASVSARSGGSVGRMHIAQEIFEGGYVKNVQHAFDKYIGRKGKAFVPKKALPAAEAVDLIHEAGGLAFVAHPGLGQERRLSALLSLPFDGIEAYHIRHSPGQVDLFLGVAQERGLLVSGGSDCHGDSKGQGPEMGKVKVPLRVYEAILDALAASAHRQ